MESDEMDQRRSWPWRMKSTSSSSPTDEILPATTDFSDVGSLSNLQSLYSSMATQLSLDYDDGDLAALNGDCRKL
ncbi:hypothetical protein LINPERHAP1_LOCUS40614 [Linum perenne]